LKLLVNLLPTQLNSGLFGHESGTTLSTYISLPSTIVGTMKMDLFFNIYLKI
jgi:hypothetical protein